MHHGGRAVRPLDVEHQAVAGDAQMQRERTALQPDRRESIFLQEVVDRDRTLVLDIGAGAADRFLIQRYRREPRLAAGGGVGAAHRGLKRIATERAWASRPSASPSTIAAGPSARSWSGPHLRMEGRFMKSRTPRPEEKRAERAVGSTWLEPPT